MNAEQAHFRTIVSSSFRCCRGAGRAPTRRCRPRLDMATRVRTSPSTTREGDTAIRRCGRQALYHIARGGIAHFRSRVVGARPSLLQFPQFQPRRSSPRGHSSHSSIDDSARRMSIHESQQEVTENSGRSYVAMGRGSAVHDASHGYGGFQSGHYDYSRQQEPPQHHRSVQVTNLFFLPIPLPPLTAELILPHCLLFLLPCALSCVQRTGSSRAFPDMVIIYLLTNLMRIVAEKSRVFP